jgi:hypothetical protein
MERMLRSDKLLNEDYVEAISLDQPLEVHEMRGINRI